MLIGNYTVSLQQQIEHFLNLLALSYSSDDIFVFIFDGSFSYFYHSVSEHSEKCQSQIP